MGTSEPSPAVTLTPSQPGGRQPGGANDQPSRSLAVSQARLNEIVAPIIRGASVDRDLIARALDALREHNWASGFAFEGTSAPGWPPLPRSDIAIRATRGIELKNEADAARARAVAYTYDHVLPPDAAALTRRLKADAPALVYVITHAALGAAKIGVSDAPGSRIAEHRRAGWQLIAAFHVAAYAACAIEDDVLRWWRHNLRLPPYLKREQMPQGGWTETVAAGAVDLAATVAACLRAGAIARHAACSSVTASLMHSKTPARRGSPDGRLLG